MSATLLLAAITIAHPTIAFEPVKLDVKAGAKFVYTTNSVTSVEAQGQSFDSTIKQKETHEIESVADGWMKIKTTINEITVDSPMSFGELPDPTGMTTSMLVSGMRKQKDFKVVANGKMTTEQVENVMAEAKTSLAGGFQGLVFPEGDLAVGTTWTVEHPPVGAGMGGLKSTINGTVKTTFKVTAINGAGADRTIMIEGKTAGSYSMNVEAPGGAGDFDIDVKTDQTANYSVRGSDGVMTKADTKTVNTMSSSFGEFVSTTNTKVELQKS